MCPTLHLAMWTNPNHNNSKLMMMMMMMMIHNNNIPVLT